MFVPSCIKTRIKSIKSDKDTISSATRGGLIAFGTELNPVYHKIEGETFIHEHDFKKENLLKKGTFLSIKCYTFELVKYKVGGFILLNYKGTYLKCQISERYKRIYKIQLPCNLYFFNDTTIEFHIFDTNRQLLGYARLLSKLWVGKKYSQHS